MLYGMTGTHLDVYRGRARLYGGQQTVQRELEKDFSSFPAEHKGICIHLNLQAGKLSACR